MRRREKRHRDSLDGRQQNALNAKLSQPTKALAAKKAKISRQTLWRYEQLPAFKKAYDQELAEIAQQSDDALKKATTGAVITLNNLMGEKYSPQVRVRAASKILDHTHKVRLQDDLAEIKEHLARMDEEDEAHDDGL